MNFDQAINSYIDHFHEGPPVFGMEEDEAIEKIKTAIRNDERIEEGAEANIPQDAHL
jgi:hypothetical protein